MPRVTIFIPTYRQKDVLWRTVRSALAQEERDLEVIVADDASPEDPAAVLTEFASDPRFRYERHAINLGRVGNYHSGLHDLANGDWFVNLDGDDELIDHSFMRRALEALDALPDPERIVAMAAGCGQERLDGSVEEMISFEGPRVVDGGDFFREFGTTSTMWLPHLSTLVRVEVARRIGFYERDILSADHESLRRLCLEGDILLLPGLAGVWNQDASSVSHCPPLATLLPNFQAFYQPWKEACRRGVLQDKEQAGWLEKALPHYVANFRHYVRLTGANWRWWRFRLVVYFVRCYPKALGALVRAIT